MKCLQLQLPANWTAIEGQQLMIIAILVTAIAPAVTAPSRATPSLPEALLEGARLCSSVGPFQMSLDSETYMDMPPEFAQQAKAKSVSSAPEIVRQYLNNSPSTRVFGKPYFVFRIATTSGDVWLFPSKGALCDVIATGDNNIPQTSTAIAAVLEKDGWGLLKKVDATPTMPLSTRLLVKFAPLPKDPSFGTSAKMRWPDPIATNEGGIHLEINFASGSITIPTKPAVPSAPEHQ